MPDRREDYHYDGALSTKLGAHRLREASDMARAIENATEKV